jgi:hypothetical protein
MHLNTSIVQKKVEQLLMPGLPLDMYDILSQMAMMQGRKIGRAKTKKLSSRGNEAIVRT